MKIEAPGGNLRLRWTHQGQRYCFSLGLKDTPNNRAIAQLKLTQIQRDIEDGKFDRSLGRYKGYVQTGITVVELFEKFIESKRKEIYSQSLIKYEAQLSRLKQYFNERTAQSIGVQDAEKFYQWQCKFLKSPVTVRERMGMLRACWNWGSEQKLIEGNPWINLAKRQRCQPVKGADPFTAEEIKRIIQGFRTHPDYSYYADFVEFLLGTGCRLGEAIALQWRDVSPDFTYVWIGRSHYRGITKETKTGKSGTIPLSKSLQQMLRHRKSDRTSPDDLVFTARRGGFISDHNFRGRAWATVIKEIKIPYRSPYSTRDTLISWWLSQGEDPLLVAKYTRTSAKTILGHYAGTVRPNAEMPDLKAIAFGDDEKSP